MAKKSNVSALPAPNLALKESEVGDQILLYDPVEDQFHALNLAAKLIWDLSKIQADEATATKTFVQFFGDADADFAKDISAAIKELRKLGIFQKAASLRVSPQTTLRLKPHAHPLQYEPPRVITYTSDWMKKNHPSAFLSVKFSDRWGPACDE